MRAIGPTLGGVAWSVTLSFGWGHVYYVFLFILVLCVAAFYLYELVHVSGAGPHGSSDKWAKAAEEAKAAARKAAKLMKALGVAAGGGKGGGSGGEKVVGNAVTGDAPKNV